MMAWGGNHFTPLLLMYRAVEGYSSVEVALFLAFYIVGLVPGFLLSAPLSIRFGSRLLVLLGLALGVGASVMLALGATAVLWICIGRLVAGMSVAIAMVVGSGWIRELTVPAGADPATASRGARRATLTITVGLGAGAGVSGALGQWGPWPTILPYAVQIGLSVVAAVFLVSACDSVPTRVNWRAPLREAIRVTRPPRRFYAVVLPLAPWVFTAGALAYAVVPALVSSRISTFSVGFATLLALVTLGVGVGVQPMVPKIARHSGGREAVAGLGLAVLGVLACIGVSIWTSLALALVAAVVLGAAYGICLVVGLVEVQAMTGPESVAGLTGLYYSLTYAGFLLPVILAAANQVASYPFLLAAAGVVGIICTVVVARNIRRPSRPGSMGAVS